MKRTLAEFYVPGVPEPKGSMRQMGKAIINASPKTAAWQGRISFFARKAAPEVWAGPVAVYLNFKFTPPRGWSAEGAHGTKPDLDKLVRCVLDGLTGVVYTDDCLVAAVVADKWWSNESGVHVHVREA